MIKEVCFVEFARTENGLTYAVQTAETAHYRAMLKKIGINASIMVDSSCAPVAEMGDSILSFSDEIIIFFVNESCIDLNRTITNYILENSDAEIVVCRKNINIVDERIKYLGDDFLKVIEYLSKKKYDNSDFINVSAYKNGIINVRDYTKYGLWLGNGSIDNEMVNDEYQLLIDSKDVVNLNNGKSVHFSGQYIQDEKKMSELLGKICQNGNDFDFVIPISDCLLKSAIIADSIFYEIDINENFSSESEKCLLTLIKNAKVKKLVFDIENAVNNKNILRIISKVDNNVIVSPYGCITEKEIPNEIKDVVLNLTKKMYYTYYRGFISSISGMYAPNQIDGYVHHLKLDNDISNISPDEINEILSINSSIFIKKSSVPEFDEVISFDDMGIAHKANTNFSLFNKYVKDKCINPSRLVFISEDYMFVDDFAFYSSAKIKNMSYTDAKKNIDVIKNNYNDPHSSTLYFVTIDNREDFDNLEEDASLFYKTHKFDNLVLGYAMLGDSCRFVSSRCQTDKLTRLNVTADGEQYVCDKSKTIKGSTLFELTQNAFLERDKSINSMECKNCNQHHWCSRCSAVPEFWSDGFCSIINRKNYVSDYIMVMVYFSGLKESVKNFSDIDAEDIKVSNEFMYNLIEPAEKPEVAPYFSKYTVLLNCKDKYVLWSPMTNKFYNVSIVFAYYIELLLNKRKMENIENYLMMKFGVSYDECRSAMSQMNEVLTKAGVFYRDINS